MKLAELVISTGAELEGGDPSTDILGAAGLDLAGPGDVTFLSNPRYTLKVRETNASAIYLAPGVEIQKEIAVLRARDPYLAYTRALRLFHPSPKLEPFVHPS